MCLDNSVGAGPCACPERSGQPQGVAPTRRANGRSPLQHPAILAVAWTALLGVSALGQLPSCPGPALPEKPGAELSIETRFFSELARLDGLLADGQIVQGCILTERFQFEIETGRGPQVWEAPAGEVLGLLPALGEAPQVLLATADGGVELRAGRLRSPLMMRLMIGDGVGATGRSPLLEIGPEGIEFFLLRGVYARLPLSAQGRIVSRVIPAFQQLRSGAELMVMRAGGVFSGAVLTEEFPLRVEGGAVRRLQRSQLRELIVQDERRVRVYLSGGTVLDGVLQLEAIVVRAFGREVQLALTEVRQVFFRDESLHFGGGQVFFCPSEPC
jgi:hypothetical protein